MKRILTIFTIIVLAVGAWAYWYYCLPVTDRFLIEVRTPKYEYAYLFSNDEKKPQIKVDKINEAYKNGKDAIAAKKEWLVRHKESLQIMLEGEMKHEPKNQSEKESQQIQMNVLYSMITADDYLLSFTHTRNFDTETFFNKMKKSGLHSYEFESYCKKNKLDYHIYNLN